MSDAERPNVPSQHVSFSAFPPSAASAKEGQLFVAEMLHAKPTIPPFHPLVAFESLWHGVTRTCWSNSDGNLNQRRAVSWLGGERAND
jgi:hypothetical protein